MAITEFKKQILILAYDGKNPYDAGRLARQVTESIDGVVIRHRRRRNLGPTTKIINDLINAGLLDRHRCITPDGCKAIDRDPSGAAKPSPSM